MTDASEHQDKFSDPALQLETVNVFGLNSKNLLNGCVTQNGFLHSNKLNITSNPLAETDEDKVKCSPFYCTTSASVIVIR